MIIQSRPSHPCCKVIKRTPVQIQEEPPIPQYASYEFGGLKYIANMSGEAGTHIFIIFQEWSRLDYEVVDTNILIRINLGKGSTPVVTAGDLYNFLIEQTPITDLIHIELLDRFVLQQIWESANLAL